MDFGSVEAQEPSFPPQELCVAPRSLDSAARLARYHSPRLAASPAPLDLPVLNLGHTHFGSLVGTATLLLRLGPTQVRLDSHVHEQDLCQTHDQLHAREHHCLRDRHGTSGRHPGARDDRAAEQRNAQLRVDEHGRRRHEGVHDLETALVPLEHVRLEHLLRDELERDAADRKHERVVAREVHERREVYVHHDEAVEEERDLVLEHGQDPVLQVRAAVHVAQCLPLDCLELVEPPAHEVYADDEVEEEQPAHVDLELERVDEQQLLLAQRGRGHSQSRKRQLRVPHAALSDVVQARTELWTHGWRVHKVQRQERRRLGEQCGESDEEARVEQRRDGKERVGLGGGRRSREQVALRVQVVDEARGAGAYDRVLQQVGDRDERLGPELEGRGFRRVTLLCESTKNSSRR